MNRIICVITISSPLGNLIVGEIDSRLGLCCWETGFTMAMLSRLAAKRFGAEVIERPTPLLHETERQLAEYFAGQRRAFELPLLLTGTSFQRRVWDALLAIPYGKTISYAQEAINVGNPRAVRAVAAANHVNPISIIVPCHRVIGSNGALVGYASGIALKQRLLALESNFR